MEILIANLRLNPVTGEKAKPCGRTETVKYRLVFPHKTLTQRQCCNHRYWRLQVMH